MAENPKSSVSGQPDSAYIVARYNAIKSEIQWRGVQRDALTVFALALTGALMKEGVFALCAPLVLLFIGSLWMRHDRRIGSAAKYLRDEVEPRLLDGVEGYERYLNRVEGGRSYEKRFHLSAVVSRLLFPTLQIASLAWGINRYLGLKHHTATSNVAVIAAVVFGALVVLVTFGTVKHVRQA